MLTPSELGQRLYSVESDEQFSHELLSFLRSCQKNTWIRFNEIAKKSENQHKVKCRVAVISLSSIPRSFQREICFNKDTFDNSDAFKVIDSISSPKPAPCSTTSL